MIQLNRCVHFYIGCQTSKGKFTGLKNGILLIENEEMKNEEFPLHALGIDIFLYLKPFKDLTEEQSKQLINEGLSIGRPHGYTFTANGFLYLVSLSIDLFGLLQSGYAKNIAGI